MANTYYTAMYAVDKKSHAFGLGDRLPWSGAKTDLEMLFMEIEKSDIVLLTRNMIKTIPNSFFDEIKNSLTDYIAIPVVSSENRRYIPIDFLKAENIAGNKLFMLPNASLYDFGILTSNVHMAWMRTVAGRMKSDYSYSNTIVYNNFPWISLTKEQEEKISQTAQAILDARALYPDSSLADLYDELTMPPELRKAHQANDKAVMQAYGMTKEVDGKKTWLTESETVARLFEMYEALAK